MLIHWKGMMTPSPEHDSAMAQNSPPMQRMDDLECRVCGMPNALTRPEYWDTCARCGWVDEPGADAGPDQAAWPERAFAFALAEPTSTFALSPSDDPAHADFLIGGRLLRDYIRPAPDAFPMFAWRHAVIVAPLRSKLRLESASDVPSGRVQIYACSHCYDPACGSISANVVRVGDRIVWSNIAQELLDVSERSDWVLRGLPGPAGFAFDAEHYLRALAGP